MSRTKRKRYKAEFGFKNGSIRKINPRIVEGGDAQTNNWIGKKKMKPYEKKQGNLKFQPEVSKTSGKITATEKLVTRNANRSRKKAYRQQLKKELKDEVQSLSGRRSSEDTL